MSTYVAELSAKRKEAALYEIPHPDIVQKEKGRYGSYPGKPDVSIKFYIKTAKPLLVSEVQSLIDSNMKYCAENYEKTFRDMIGKKSKVGLSEIDGVKVYREFEGDVSPRSFVLDLPDFCNFPGKSVTDY